MRKKSLIKTLILATMIMVLFVPTVAFADEIPATMTNTSQTTGVEQPGDKELLSLPVVYTVKSKTFQANLNKVWQKDWTPSWAKATSYQLMQGWSWKASLTVDATAEISDGVKASGQFVVERTYSCNVTTTIPADSTRYSKLTHYRDFKQYSAEVWCQAGVNPAYFLGNYIVKEPAAGSYNEVRYQ